MVEPKLLLAARTDRSISAEVDLTFELTSFDAATSALCAVSALAWMLSVVLAVTVPSDRSMSVEIALIWLAASADVAASELCASRALPRIEAAVSAPTAVKRAFHIGRQRLDVVGGVRGCGDQRGLGLARAGGDRLGGRRSRRATANVRRRPASDLTWLAASVEAVTSVVWTSRGARRWIGGGGCRRAAAGQRLTWLDVGRSATWISRVAVSAVETDSRASTSADSDRGRWPTIEFAGIAALSRSAPVPTR